MNHVKVEHNEIAASEQMNICFTNTVHTCTCNTFFTYNRKITSHFIVKNINFVLQCNKTYVKYL